MANITKHDDIIIVKSNVANTLSSAAANHVVAVADDVFDEDLKLYQSEINQQISNIDISNKADLVDGKVPASQLPSYVDDVIEAANKTAFPATGESGKIYVALDTNKTYRWSGTEYVEISASLALGETSSTAYRGDRGKTAYDHSQTAHAPSNAQANTIETVKVNGTALTPDVNKAVDITVPDYDDRLDDLEAKVTEIPVPSKEKYKGYITITDLLALTPDQIGVDDLYKVYASKNTDNSWDGSNFTFNNQSYPAGTFINRINGEWVVSENQEPELTKTISFDPPVERFNLITKGDALKAYPAFDGISGWDMFHWVQYSEKNLGTGKYEKTVATGTRGQQTDDFRFIFPYSKDGNYLSQIGGEDLFCPTSSQVSAMNSGITSTKVSTYDEYATSKQDALTPGTGIDITDNVITCTNAVSQIYTNTSNSLRWHKIAECSIDPDNTMYNTNVTLVMNGEDVHQGVVTASTRHYFPQYSHINLNGKLSSGRQLCLYDVNGEHKKFEIWTNTGISTSFQVSLLNETGGWTLPDDNQQATEPGWGHIADGSISGSDVKVVTQVNSLNGYATEEWVEDKGYLTTDRTTITVGSTNLTGNSGTSKNGITLAAGNNVTLTPDATNNKVTISATVSPYYFNSRGHAGAAITDNNKWVCFATLEVPTSGTGAMSWSGNYSVVCRATHLGSLNGILTYNLRVNSYNSVSHIFLGTDNSAFAGKFKLTYNNSDRKFRLYVKEDEEWVNYTFQELQTYNNRFIAIPENEQTFTSEPTKPSSGMIATSVCYSGGVTSVNTKKGAVVLSANDVNAVSTVASQGLTDEQKSNARANIGAGTSNLTIGTTSTTAAAGDHTHSGYVAKAGDTMTGTLTLKKDQYLSNNVSGIDANNSDIIKVNSIYTADNADSTAEGIRFYRDTTHWDSLTANGGNLYFMPNDTQTGTAFSNSAVKKVEFQGHTHSGYLSSKTLWTAGNNGTAQTDKWREIAYKTSTATSAESTVNMFSVKDVIGNEGSWQGILTVALRLNNKNDVTNLTISTDNPNLKSHFIATYDNATAKCSIWASSNTGWNAWGITNISDSCYWNQGANTLVAKPTKPSSGKLSECTCYSGGVTSVAGKTGAVTLDKSDVGLDNVGNFKAVSTVASQGLTDTEKSNARTNIGAGTSNLTIGTTSTTAAAGNHTHDNYLPKANGHVTTASSLFFDYANLVFATSGTDSNKNGDIVWRYGNGSEKARLYLSDTYTSGVMPSFRVYKADGTKLKEGSFAWSDHTHTGMLTNAVNNLSAVNYLNWGTAASNSLPTTSTIAYWNGAYNSNGSSNLTYCNRGAFGTMATKNSNDYYTATSVESMVSQREKKLSVSTDNKGSSKTGKYYLLATITVTNWLPLYGIPFIYSQCVHDDPNGQGIYSGMFNIFLCSTTGTDNPYVQIDPMIADYVEVSYSGNNVYIYGKQMDSSMIAHNLWTPDLNYRWSSRYTITFTQPSNSEKDQDLSSVTGTKFTKKLTHPKEVICTQTEYNAITTKDSNTIYFIKE